MDALILARIQNIYSKHEPKSNWIRSPLLLKNYDIILAMFYNLVCITIRSIWYFLDEYPLLPMISLPRMICCFTTMKRSQAKGMCSLLTSMPETKSWWNSKDSSGYVNKVMLGTSQNAWDLGLALGTLLFTLWHPKSHEMQFYLLCFKTPFVLHC